MSIYYDFVDFLKPRRFESKRRDLSGKLLLHIKTLTPLHIGSGKEERRQNQLYKSFIRYKGEPVIPGSTVKGVLRTVSEAVSYSCVQVHKGLKEKLPFSIANCSCMVCETYGRQGLKGSIIFRDFLLRRGDMKIIKIPKLFKPQINKKEIYYNKDGHLRGIKFYKHGDYTIIKKAVIPVEAVKENALFDGEILFESIHQEQLELLCYALGLDKSFQLKIGGNKAGFFGSCQVEVKEAFLNGESFRPYEYACNYKKHDYDVVKNKKKLSEILSYNNRVTTL